MSFQLGLLIWAAGALITYPVLRIAVHKSPKPGDDSSIMKVVAFFLAILWPLFWVFAFIRSLNRLMR